MKRAPLILALVVVVASVAHADGAATSPLAASYVYAGGSTDVNAMFASVETVVKKMSFLVRSIARRRLRKPNMPCAKLELAIDATEITVVRVGQSKVAAPRNGATATWRGPEGVFAVTHVLDGSTLVETLVGTSSRSTNRYTLGADGVSLDVRTEIVSRRLPGPVEFVMHYRKQE